MEKTYGIVPREEHYNCIIGLLGWAGRLKEAEAFINGMPVEQNAFGWCSFLGACNVHGNERSHKSVAEKLIKLEPENTRAIKLPFYSWVDVGNKTHIFGAEDWSHPFRKDIYEKLDSLLMQKKKAGYVPCTDSVAVDMNDSEKEKLVHHHSKRIVIAFALILLPYGKPIIVKKNFKVC
ncbi:hypothetical protein TIFTF001_008702 [Ficus carica]|uniref:DYW domain-containing protein n=1 Tax=Ficus carica TaxID=3494 RepID=A0AA87ZVC8_FICCA|nr:hypothetical protein TIFTF001_008702 [Ficus carica]